jgi:hypothetical protein
MTAFHKLPRLHSAAVCARYHRIRLAAIERLLKTVRWCYVHQGVEL